MLRTAVTDINPNIILLGWLPTKESTKSATRKCSPQRSTAVATIKPPINKNTVS